MDQIYPWLVIFRRGFEMIKTIWPASMSIGNFRNFKNVKFSLGRQITLISGQNGSGKSNLLSLIASSCGESQKSELGSNFQPDFNDFFSVDETENYTAYSLFVDFNDSDNKLVLRKKLTFKNDSKTNRGIRIIPRTIKLDESDKRRLRDIEKEAKEKYGVGGAARVPIPTIYLSISRLYPLGEKKDNILIKKCSERNSLYQRNANGKFAEWYNRVIPGAINTDGNLSIIKKETISRRASFHMDMSHTPALSQSVGQDNLANIISAFVDVYMLSLQPNYKGALICIDEIDVSLHPDTQIRLLELMMSLADQLNCQFVLTTHSLTMLKELSKQEKKSPRNYRIVYLKNPSSPYVEQNNDYYALKADLFNQLSYTQPQVKVYFEDDIGKKMFSMLMESLKNQIEEVRDKSGYLRDRNNISEQINKQLLDLAELTTISDKLKLIPTQLGCEDLIKISEADAYFMRVIMILDGDARIKNGKNVIKPQVRDYLDKVYIGHKDQDRMCKQNICFFPGYFAPESYIYKMIYILVNHQDDHLIFWRSLDQYEYTAMYTRDKIRDIISERPEKFTNDDLKRMFKNQELNLWDFVKKSNIVTYFYGSYETIGPLIEFGNAFMNALKIAMPLTLYNRYS